MFDSVQSYPCAERLPLVEQVHGHSVADPYRSLEDAGSDATRQWLAAQDELWLNHAAGLTGRFRFRTRVKALSNVGTVSAPSWRGDRCFTLRREPGRQHPVLYADQRAILDPMAIDPSGRTTLDAWQPSPDGSLVAYQLSRSGSEDAVLQLLDVESGELIGAPIDGCRYSPVAWLPDGKSFYYVRFRQVHRYHLDLAADTTVLATEASYGLEISADGRWLTISAARGPANDLWLQDLASGEPPRPIQQSIDALTIMSVGPDGRLYIVTTKDAPTGRVCVGDPNNPLIWHDLVTPESPLTGLAILSDVLLVGTLQGIAVHDLGSGERLGAVELPGVGSVGELTTRADGGSQAWFSYTDSVTPATVYCYDHTTGLTSLWSQPPGVVAEAESHQLVTTSPDGAEVRLLVISRPGETGPRPALLYGYGGFGQTLTPTYSAFALAWVEAGGIFVTATLRGGGERGAESHHAGILDRKQRVFDDFIAAAEHLIATGWTTSEQLSLCGESNGGLLVAAALTQRPELFAAAVCSAPLTDMVRYEHSGLGERWVPEFGSVSDPAQFESLLAYSPYHRVAEGVKYPAVLLTAFGNDTRVDPLHARKFCAALQHATAGPRPVVLRLDPDAGHASGSAGQGISLAADMLAFLAAETGLTA
ncbi:S9 family peptidase [Kribbella sandramycini]|uniref:prolyl oligopeptidase n=1 Tax=Kribbella sandramycini TaxID=60450 RepID=A0A7Y4P0L7_9ACTN|nr:prolyl oligopeptidase family serine peptidase [Kribbella sandramycini]MBB6564998.1 prolyl oligopeptidase [Kribbella sandramycini]NOL41270.1 S9 family peptidase [Kribbella sandramycini]